MNFREILAEIATDDKLSPSKLYAFSKMNRESLELFREIWPTIPVDRRRAIVQELMETAEVNFEVDFDPVFLIALGDKDAVVRATAIKSLWEYEEPSLIVPLVHLLKTDEALSVREAAASALGKFIYLRELEDIDWNEATLAEEALLEAIYQGDENIDVKRRAIEAIAFSSNPRVPQIIESAYYSDHDRMQVSAIFAMGRSADSRWTPQVIEELDNSNTELRFEAARACGELEARDAVDKLVLIIDDDPDVEVQQMAIWALGRIGGETARLVLEACLESDIESLALAAEESLDELNIFSEDMILFDFDDVDDEDELEEYLDIYSANGKDDQ